MFVALSLLLLVLAVHLSACSAGEAPSTDRLNRHSETTEINGRLYYKHSLLPADGGYSEDNRNSDLKRAMLRETLDPLLIDPLIEIVAGYRAGHTLQFAEDLYAELWEGKTDLLHRELCDAEMNILAESHAFWDYLSEGTRRVMGFVHTLQRAQGKHPELKKTLERFAKAVLGKVPQTGCLIGQYLDGTLSFWLNNVWLDEWPNALINDQTCLTSKRHTHHDVVAGVYYLLMQGTAERLKNYLDIANLNSDGCIHMFRTLYAVEPSLLSKFFDIEFATDSARDMKLFRAAAPAAISIDPSLSSVLLAIAERNGCEEVVAERVEVPAALADNAEAGGSVHMQPLIPFAQSLDIPADDLWHAASSTGKTVADRDGLQLYVAAGNVLCALSTRYCCYLQIRSFADDTVSAHELATGHAIKVNVQHGDVIVLNQRKHCPPFLKEKGYCAGLSEKERFERVKSFFYRAIDFQVNFVVIVESDQGERTSQEFKSSDVQVEEIDAKSSVRKRKDGGKGKKHASKKDKEGERQAAESPKAWRECGWQR